MKFGEQMALTFERNRETDLRPWMIEKFPYQGTDSHEAALTYYDLTTTEREEVLRIMRNELELKEPYNKSRNGFADAKAINNYVGFPMMRWKQGKGSGAEDVLIPETVDWILAYGQGRIDTKKAA